MNEQDYNAIKSLIDSYWWEIIKKNIQEKIDIIEDVLLTPTTDGMLWKNKEETANLIEYKKMERIHLKNLQKLPELLLSTRINKKTVSDY